MLTEKERKYWKLTKSCNNVKPEEEQTRMCIKKLHSIMWDKHITRHTKSIIYKKMVQNIRNYGN